MQVNVNIQGGKFSVTQVGNVINIFVEKDGVQDVKKAIADEILFGTSEVSNALEKVYKLERNDV